jgi:CrcB protein
VSVPEWLGIAASGAIGAFARFAVDATVSSRAGRELPFGTFTVNLLGAFTLGLLIGIVLDSSAFRLAGTALIGSYTTFSTWMLETHRLVEDGQLRNAAINVVVSVIAGVTVAALGRWIGGAL